MEDPELGVTTGPTDGRRSAVGVYGTNRRSCKRPGNLDTAKLTAMLKVAGLGVDAVETFVVPAG